MNYKKLRSWLLIGVVSSVAALFIGTTVTSCAKNLNNIANTPGNNEPISPPLPEDNNDHNKPDTSKPSISRVSINIVNNNVVEGQTIHATASVYPSGLSGVKYQWSIDNSSTIIDNSGSDSVTFKAKKEDSGRTLRVVASYNGTNVSDQATLVIKTKPTPNPNPVPNPTPSPEPEPPKPTPAPTVKDISLCDFQIEGSNFVYNKSQHTPNIIVTDNGTRLQKDVDYTVKYTNNTEAGAANILINGKDKYNGSKQLTFTITQAPNTIKSFTIDTNNNPKAIVEFGDATYKYFNDPACKNFVSETKPKTDGEYYVKAYSGTSKNYLGQESSSILPITIGEEIEENPDAPYDIRNADIHFKRFINTYSGKQLTPKFSLTDAADNNSPIVEDWFTCTYGENLNVGKGTITVKGKQIYKGKKTFVFDIVKKQNGINHFQIKDGQPYAECLVGKPTFQYFKDQACTQPVTGVPTTAGKYYVRAVSEGNENYAANKSFVIPYYVKPVTASKPAKEITYILNINKTSGLNWFLYDLSVTIEVFKKSDLTKAVWTGDFVDLDPAAHDNKACIKLPPDDYVAKIKMDDELASQYNWHASIDMTWRDGVSPFDTMEQMPEYCVSFDPILKPETPANRYLKFHDVIPNLQMTDIYGNEFTIRDNSFSTQKPMIFIFFRSTCGNSIASIQALIKKMNAENWEDKINVFLVTNDSRDYVNTLDIFLSDLPSNMYAIQDMDNRIRSHFFDPYNYPKFAFVDYQGVVLKTMETIKDNPDNYTAIGYGIKNYDSSYDPKGGN